MSDNSVSGGGIGLGGLLTVLFVGLKLGHVIDWSWWWVVSPLWISAGFSILCLAVLLLIAAVTD